LKLSERTFKVLENFNKINPSILVRPGSTLETMAPTKKVVAKATIEEEFDREFAIYDLSRFLGAVSLFKEPEISFSEASIVITSEGRRLNYVYANPETVVAPPKSGIKFPDESVAPHVSFRLTRQVFTDVTKAASVLGMPEIAVVGDGATVSLAVADVKNPTAHGFAVPVGETEHRFRLIFRGDTFKFIPDDYDVTVSLRKIARFTSAGAEYMVVAEDTSSVG
jgi:hypothetical protein